MPPHKHQELMTAAVQRDGEGQAALLAGDREAARAAFAAAARLYRESWEVAPASAYGRLVGMLKSAVLAGGDAVTDARYARDALAEADPESVTAAYGLALAALIVGEDDEAVVWAARMKREPSGASGPSDAFVRAGEAIEAVALGDAARFAEALAAIVRDFEARTEHLTGVAIADTALVVSALASRRGMAAAIESPVLPAL